MCGFTGIVQKNNKELLGEKTCLLFEAAVQMKKEFGTIKLIFLYWAKGVDQKYLLTANGI